MTRCPQCQKQAVFNKPGEKKGLYCKTHKLVGMIDIRNKKCGHPDCPKQPAFNTPGQKKALYCADHKLVGMLNVVTRRCAHDGCHTVPIFNQPGKKGGLYCSEHKLASMIDVKSILCAHDGCNIIPIFNKPGERKGLYCLEHKLADMIDVRSKICAQDGCHKYPIFNYPGETKRLYCCDHKLLGMIDVKHIKCVHQGCLKQPAFNTPDQKISLYCADHKLVGMVNVKTQKCAYDGCDIVPTFNTPGERKGLYCSDHRLVGMKDVKSPKCVHDGCDTHPSYGYPGEAASYCSPHHPDGTIKNSLRWCQAYECKEVATHGANRDGLAHCELHALPDEICLVERACSKCSRIDILNKDGLCVNFCCLEESYRSFKKQVKQKEEVIGKLLKEKIELPLYSSDKIIDSSCTRRRPDFVYNLGTHILIIEVDENQHNGYRCTAYGSDKDGKTKGEMIRMYEVGQCFDGLPVLFLRYNPDTYKATGKASQSERRDVLVRWVKHCLTYQEWMKGFLVKYLFYDGYDPACVEWQEVKAIIV